MALEKGHFLKGFASLELSKNALEWPSAFSDGNGIKDSVHLAVLAVAWN